MSLGVFSHLVRDLAFSGMGAAPGDLLDLTHHAQTGGVSPGGGTSATVSNTTVSGCCFFDSTRRRYQRSGILKSGDRVLVVFQKPLFDAGLSIKVDDDVTVDGVRFEIVGPASEDPDEATLSLVVRSSTAASTAGVFGHLVRDLAFAGMGAAPGDLLDLTYTEQTGGVTPGGGTSASESATAVEKCCFFDESVDDHRAGGLVQAGRRVLTVLQKPLDDASLTLEVGSDVTVDSTRYEVVGPIMEDPDRATLSAVVRGVFDVGAVPSLVADSRVTAGGDTRVTSAADTRVAA